MLLSPLVGKGQPNRFGLFRSLPLSALWLLVCGLCASLAVSYWVYRQEQRIEQANFEGRARSRVAAVQEGVSNAEDALEVVHQLFVTNNGSVSRAQFHSFTQPLLARYPYIESFSFCRVLSKEERPAFEEKMRVQNPGFRISEMVDGKRVPATVKDSYRVIDYVEPMAGHEAAFGLDVTSRTFHNESISRATDSGLPAASSLVQLFKDKAGAHRGFRLRMAVYQGGDKPDNVAARRRAVVGYVVVTLRADALFEKILAVPGSQGNAGLDIRVYAADTPDESKRVYGAASRQHEQWQPSWLLGDRIEPVSHNFDIAGTAWHMSVAAQQAPFESTHASALLALLMGLVATVATTAYLRSVVLRTQQIEQLVAQRTDQLKRTNDLLVQDIAARKKVEQELARSEKRARELTDLSSDWSWEQDDHFRFTSFSAGAREKTGELSLVLLGKTRWDQPIDLTASDWPGHCALLEAHQPFRNFEYKRQVDGIPIEWISVSGTPQFDAAGNFKGYRGTGRNISNRKRAEQALRDSEAALRQLAAHQEQVKESERKRIAREIHDDLGQNLMVLRLDLTRMMTGNDAETIPKAGIEAALNQIDMTIKAVRAIINDLRPAALDLGLHAAVQWQAKEFERRTGITCEVNIDHDEFDLGELRATALFRVVQESLTNIIRHSHAHRVQIDIKRNDGQLYMKIADDGVGIDLNSPRKEKAFGLIGIEERIVALGGTFAVVSRSGEGMTIVLSIPLSALS
jgi:PAS domain S-box-containing protein